MDLLKKLRGITGSLFKIGGQNGGQIKNNSGNLEIRNAADSGYAILRAKEILTGSGKNDLATLFDIQARVPNIEFSFDGASAPAAGTNTNLYGFCHTTGGGYTAGDVVFDDGSNLITIPTELCRHITTKDAVTGTISLIANGIYALESGSYVLKGDGTGVSTGIIRVIELDIVFGSTNVDSTTSIPAGARVLETDVRVDTPFTGGTSPTVEVKTNGSTPLTLMTTTENDLENSAQYVVEEIFDIASINAGTVRAAVTNGASTAGAGKVFVYYVTPLA